MLQLLVQSGIRLHLQPRQPEPDRAESLRRHGQALPVQLRNEDLHVLVIWLHFERAKRPDDVGQSLSIERVEACHALHHFVHCFPALLALAACVDMHTPKRNLTHRSTSTSPSFAHFFAADCMPAHSSSLGSGPATVSASLPA